MDLGYSNILMEKMTESRYFGETLYITLLCLVILVGFTTDIVGFTSLIFWMYYKLIPSVVNWGQFTGREIAFFGWKSCDMAGSCGMICKSQRFYTRKAFINYTP